MTIDTQQAFAMLTEHGVNGVLAICLVVVVLYCKSLINRNTTLTDKMVSIYKEHANELMEQNEKNRAIQSETVKALDRLSMMQTMGGQYNTPTRGPRGPRSFSGPHSGENLDD